MGKKKSVDERLNDELKMADDIIGEYESPTIDNPPKEQKETRIVNARRERGLTPRL